MNLRRMVDQIDLLPEYLRFESYEDEDGKITKATKNATTLRHPVNGNSISIKPKATSYEKALSIARGMTAPLQQFDYMYRFSLPIHLLKKKKYFKEVWTMTDQEFLSKISDETKEEWRQVKLDGELINYDVSNFGRIRRHNDKFMLKPSKHKKMKNCYLFIALKKPDGRILNTSVHRLVAMMFVDIGDEYKKEGLGFNDLTVDHLDGIKYHNLPENLEWVTLYENNKRAYENNDNFRHNTLSEMEVIAVCELICHDVPYNEIASIFGISEETVAAMRYGIAQKYITKNYAFPKSQLTKDKVIEIADYLMEGYSIDEIAKMTDVHRSSVERIKYKQSWADITKDYVFPLKQIKEEDAHIICKLLQEGKSTKYIHEKYGYSKSTIKHIRQGTRWTHVSKNYNIESNRYKVKDEVIENICAMLAMKIPMTIISEKTSVSYGFVKCIKARKYRKDITDKYQW